MRLHRARSRAIFFGWYIVGASFVLMLMYGFFLTYGFAVFFPVILDEFGWSKAETSLAYGILAVEAGAMSPVYGWLVHRFGTRGPLMAGTVVGGAGLLILSQMNSLPVFYAGFLLAGLGLAAYYTAPIAAIANWFRVRRAQAMGMCLAGFAVAALLIPVLRWLVEGFGWRAVLAAGGIASFCVCLPVCLLLRHRPEPYGLAVDGGGEVAPEVAEDLRPEVSARQALRTPVYWLICAVYTTAFLSLSGMLPHLLQFYREVGIPGDLAAFSFSGYAVASLIGRIGGGYLSDRIDKRRIIAASHLAIGLGTIGIAYTSEPWHLLYFSLFVGIGYAIAAPAIPALISDVFGTRSFALLYGLSILPATLFWMIAPGFAGWVSDHFGTYQLVFAGMGWVTLLATPLALLIRTPKLSGH